MGSFCGPGDTLTVNRSLGRPNILDNECFLDGLEFVPHVLLFLITLPVVILLSKSRNEVKGGPWVHFPGHTVRWIFTLILMVIHLCEIGEGVIAEFRDEGPHLHLYLTHCVALIGCIVSIIYYTSIETWNSPRLLLALLIYWIGALTIKCMKLVSLFKKGLSVNFVRFNFTWDVVILYTILLLVELNVLRKLVRKISF